MKSKDKLLQIPRGTESFYLEEAYLHRRISASLSGLFYSWGYLPIETPLFDFYDIYKPLLDPAADEKIYRLIDRDGDLLMLRSDITLFMAKQMGLALTERDLPVRVCYSDAILRYQSREDISHNEFYQVGAELIGRDGMEGDLEILLLLLSSLKLLGLEDARLHIGTRKLFDTVFKGYGDGEKKKLQSLILLRNWDVLTEYLEERGNDSEWIVEVVNIFSSILEGEDLKSLKIGSLNGNIEKEIDYMKELYDKIDTLGFKDYLRIDFSEVGTQPYYTGIVFEVYVPGVDSAVASGGRYNRLLERFGFDSPAVGFSILLRKIEASMKRLDDFMPLRNIVKLKEGNFLERFKKAERLRERGKIVVL